jgi:hypothetical protein
VCECVKRRRREYTDSKYCGRLGVEVDGHFVLSLVTTLLVRVVCAVSIPPKRTLQ